MYGVWAVNENHLKTRPGSGAGTPPATAFSGRRKLTTWVAIAGLGVALTAIGLSTSGWNLLRLGALVLVLILWLILRGGAPRFRFLSVRIPPKVLLVVIGLSLGIALSEISLRLFLFQSFANVDRAPRWRRTMGYQYDRLFGWFPIPNSRLTFSANRTVSVVHNSRGFRDPEPTFDDRPGILFLGDSFVWGFNVEATDRFTEKLRARHPEWQIYNFGVSGYSTGQEYLLLQQHFEEYHPRVVFLVFCTENDDRGNCSNTSSGRYYKPYFRSGPQGLTLSGVPVPHSERVFCVQHPLLSKLYTSRLLVRAYGNLLYPPPRFETSPTKPILRALREYTSDHGALFCVGLTRKAPEIETFLQSLKVPCLNLSTDLRVPNDVHWSPAGHTLVAKKVGDFLEHENLGLKAGRASPSM